jgi:hypothetical protein
MERVFVMISVELKSISTMRLLGKGEIMNENRRFAAVTRSSLFTHCYDLDG